MILLIFNYLEILIATSVDNQTDNSEYNRTGILRCGNCNKSLEANRILVYNQQDRPDQANPRFIIFHRCVDTQCPRFCPLFTRVDAVETTTVNNETREIISRNVTYLFVRPIESMEAENTDHLNLLPPIEE